MIVVTLHGWAHCGARTRGREKEVRYGDNGQASLLKVVGAERKDAHLLLSLLSEHEACHGAWPHSWCVFVCY